MGGRGSGRYGLAGGQLPKRACEEFYSIDIRQWERKGMLAEHVEAFSAKWMDEHGEEEASVTAYPNDPVKGAIRLSYSARGEHEEQVIPTTQTPNNYGARTWFVCGGCRKRYAKLYFEDTRYFFACRNCLNLNYRSSQIEGDEIREIDRKLSKLSHRLGGSYKVDAPVPDKPKGMHWETYNRLAMKYKWWSLERDEVFVSQALATLKRIGQNVPHFHP